MKDVHNKLFFSRRRRPHSSSNVPDVASISSNSDDDSEKGSNVSSEIVFASEQEQKQEEATLKKQMRKLWGGLSRRRRTGTVEEQEEDNDDCEGPTEQDKNQSGDTVIATTTKEEENENYSPSLWDGLNIDQDDFDELKAFVKEIFVTETEGLVALRRHKKALGKELEQEEDVVKEIDDNASVSSSKSMLDVLFADFILDDDFTWSDMYNTMQKGGEVMYLQHKHFANQVQLFASRVHTRHFAR